ncbi:MAG: ornithine cyclodeaminase, partial [Acidimicrobiia bacterium]|nr:ornithine cyclodeaminase [Acidimicrobiia bacterium]
MRYLGPADLRAALPMGAAIEAMVIAFGDDREVPARIQIGQSLFMPGRVGEMTGIKVVSTVPGSPTGIVVVFDGSGRPIGLVDGPTLTAIRTGAGAG